MLFHGLFLSSLLLIKRLVLIVATLWGHPLDILFSCYYTALKTVNNTNKSQRYVTVSAGERGFRLEEGVPQTVVDG